MGVPRSASQTTMNLSVIGGYTKQVKLFSRTYANIQKPIYSSQCLMLLRLPMSILYKHAIKYYKY